MQWMTEAEMKEFDQIEYEQQLNFNRLLSWVHSIRYKKVLEEFTRFNNQLQKTHRRPIQVLEIGCAQADLFNLLNKKFNIGYHAIELEIGVYEEACKRYGKEANFNILHADATDPDAYQKLPFIDVVVALETFEHVPERNVVRIIEQISSLHPSLFLCSVPVEVGPAVWFKNITSWLLRYSRHKQYSWNETFWAGVYQLDKLPPHGIEHKGFDWRWLAQTIRHNMKITAIKKFPFNFLPAPLANSIFISAITRNIAS